MTNVQEYRLKAFESAFTEPGIEYFSERPGLVSDMESWFEGWGLPGFMYMVDEDGTPFFNTADPVHEHAIGPPGDSPSSLGLLYLCLLTEADNWITAGRRLGYFPEAAKSTFMEMFNLQAHRRKLEYRYLGTADFEVKNDLGFRDADEFGDSLSATVEDLTAERIEYLWLTMFATDSEWESQLRQVRTLAANVAIRPDASVPPDVMKDVAWMFYGPEAEPTEWTVALSEQPSAWRIERTWDYNLGYGLENSAGRQTAERRLIEFRKCRHLFETAARTISVNENATVVVHQRRALENLLEALQRTAPEARPVVQGEDDWLLFERPPNTIKYAIKEPPPDQPKFKQAGQSD